MIKRKHVVTTLKIAFVVAFLYLLFKKGFISVDATRSAFTHWEYMGPAVAIYVLNLCIGIVRWQILLRAQRLHLTWSRVAQLAFVGNFFNVALPGAVSGDFVKAYYIGQEAPGQRGRAFGSILFDRLVGVSALVLVSAGALTIGLADFIETPLFRGIQVLVTTGAVCVIAFFSYLFFVREHHDPLLTLFRTLEKKIPRVASITQVYLGLRQYHHSRGAALQALALSLCVHVLVSWQCLFFARALGVSNLNLLSLCVVVPLGLLLTAVPVAPAGVGTGHAAFLYFFHLLGSERGADVYSLVAVVTVFFGGLGGLVYLQFRAKVAPLPHGDLSAEALPNPRP